MTTVNARTHNPGLAHPVVFSHPTNDTRPVHRRAGRTPMPSFQSPGPKTRP